MKSPSTTLTATERLIGPASVQTMLFMRGPPQKSAARNADRQPLGCQSRGVDPRIALRHFSPSPRRPGPIVRRTLPYPQARREMGKRHRTILGNEPRLSPGMTIKCFNLLRSASSGESEIPGQLQDRTAGLREAAALGTLAAEIGADIAA